MNDCYCLSNFKVFTFAAKNHLTDIARNRLSPIVLFVDILDVLVDFVSGCFLQATMWTLEVIYALMALRVTD